MTEKPEFTADANAQQLLQSIIESIGVGVIVADPEGRIVLFNGRAGELLKLGSTSAPASEWSRIYGMYHTDKVTLLSEDENPLVRAMRGESLDELEIFIHNENASERWVNAKCRPVLNSDGANVGGVVVLQDVTDQLRLAEDVKRSNHDLQQFAYVAAHDLQEPLRSIVGFGELLELGSREVLDTKQKDQLRRILEASKRMQLLISGLLAYARVETRAKPFELCDLKQIFQNATSDLSSAIKKVDAEVTQQDLPEVLGDKSQLTQVFQNLISNALKYCKEKPVIKVSCVSDKKFHRFCIEDNGIGIDMQFADRIFIIFQRLHTKSQYEGVGIGLSLCKKIIEKHGGRIWIESKLNEGTKVFFTLPKKFQGS